MTLAGACVPRRVIFLARLAANSFFRSGEQ